MKLKQFIVIFITLVTFMFTSCNRNGTDKDPFGVDLGINSTELDSTSQYYHLDYEVYTLEGCEYIVVDSGSSKWGSHKGNCKNPIHKR